MGMASQSVEIVNKKGLHARASAAFAKLALQYDSEVRVKFDGLDVDGKLMMDVMMLVAYKGATITIHAEGADAETAATALAQLVADGFGELGSDEEEQSL